MFPLVLTRRSVYRDARRGVAIGFLAMIVITTVALRLQSVPQGSTLRPVRIEWAWGLYASGAFALLGLALAPFFGGRLDDLPTRMKRDEGETLH